MKSPDELFDRYLDGDITPEEFERLETWIDEAPEHARQFVEWSATHLYTRSGLKANALHDAVVQSVAPEKLQIAVASSPGTRLGHRFLYQHLVTAACVALLMAVGFWLVQQQSAKDTPGESVAQGDAQIIQRIDCVLEQDPWSVQEPMFQAGESIQLSQGVVVIEFARGASVTLEGPADLEVLSDNSGFLHKGKLSAVVPESAIGFEIQTPDSRVIDHGTEFAVRVDSAGVSETHVFEGEVELVEKTIGDATEPQSESKRLFATEAVRFDGGVNPTSQSIPARPLEFIRIPVRTAAQRLDHSSVTSLPQPGDLVMWFEASQGVQLDADSRVVSWQNLAGRSGDASAAWQISADHRPFYEPGDESSRPTIRFDAGRKEFLATSLIRTRNDTTVILVCEFGKRSVPGYGQMLMLSGAAKLAMRQEWNNVASAQIRWWKNQEHSHLKMATPASNATPLVLACRYSFVKNSFQLFADGELVAEDVANGPIAREASHLIGCRQRDRNFFTGSIAEIAVYDCWLDRDACNDAMSVLMKKYAVGRE